MKISFVEVWDSIGWKDPEDNNKVKDMHYLIAMIMFEMAAWCNVRDIPFTIVDTISTQEEDTLLNRISSSHRDRRAFDLRSHSFTKTQKYEFVNHFNEKYKEDASISYSDFKARLVVLHGDGPKEHFHVAINSRYAIKEIATNYVEQQ